MTSILFFVKPDYVKLLLQSIWNIRINYIIIFCAIYNILFPELILANQLYEVKNLIISKSASTTTQARELAINDGYKAAFNTLLSTLGSRQSNYPLNNNVITNFIRDFELTDEKMSPGHYYAVMSVSFSKPHVDQFLLSNKINKLELEKLQVYVKGDYSEVVLPSDTSDKTLILPIIRKANKIILWDDSNEWLEKWKTIINENDNSDYVLPLGDLEDMTSTARVNILAAEYSSYTEILNRYKSNNLIIAIADITQDPLSKIYKLALSLRTLNKISTTGITENFALLKGENPGELYLQGVNIFLSKQQNYTNYFNIKPHGSDENSIIMCVKINLLKDWLEVQRRLDKSKLISKYNVKRISLGEFFLNVYYYNNINDLGSELLNLGLLLKTVNGYVTIELI